MRFIREADDNGKCPSFCLDYREDKESGFSFFFEDLLIANGFVTGRCGEWDCEKNTYIVSMYISSKAKVPYGSYQETWDELRDIYKTAKQEYKSRLTANA